MKYDIVDVRVKYLWQGKDQPSKLQEVAVLWKDGECVRATHKIAGGVPGSSLNPQSIVDEKLFQNVCAYGSYMPDDLKVKYFGKQKWSR